MTLYINDLKHLAIGFLLCVMGLALIKFIKGNRRTLPTNLKHAISF
jgi:hypothetical protein